MIALFFGSVRFTQHTRESEVEVMKAALKHLGLPVLAALILCASQSVHAATLTWDPGHTPAAPSGGSGNWDATSANWSNGATDVVWTDTTGTDTAVFSGTAGTVKLVTGITANGITIGTAGYVITNNTLTLAGTTPTITSNANGAINSILAGAAGLTTAGTATLSLGGTNTYTGATSIGGNGTVVLNNPSALGAAGAGNGTSVASGSTLQIACGGSIAEILTINGTGVGGTAGAVFVSASVTSTANVAAATASTINVADGSIWTIGTSNPSITATGAVTKIGLGTLAVITSTNGAGGFVLNAGLFTANGNVNLNSGNIQVNSGATLQTTGGANAIADGVLVTVASGGVFDFSQNSTETINTLTLNGSGIGGFGAWVSNVQNGTTLTSTNGIVLNANSTIGSPNNLATPSVISGAFTLTKVRNGALTSTISGTNTPFGTGSLQHNGGTLALTPGAAAAGLTGVSAATTSTFGYGGGSILALTHNGANQLTYTIGNAAPSVTVLGRTTPGTLQISTSAATLTTLGVLEEFVVNGLTSAANVNGIYNPTIVAQNGNVGTFVKYSATAGAGFVDAASGTSSYTARNAAVVIPANEISDVTGSFTATTASNPFALRVGAFTLTNGGTTTVNGAAGQAGVILNSTATASTIAGGTLAFGASEGVIFTATTGAGNGTISSAISGTGGLTKFGPGTLVLSGTNTYSGGTNVNQGVLSISADANLGATAAANLVTLNGATLSSSNTTAFTLNANHGIAIGLNGGTINGAATGAHFILGTANMLTGSGLLTITGAATTDSVLSSNATQGFSGPMTVASGRIILNTTNITNPFGTGDITVNGTGEIFVQNTGSVWPNRLFISTTGGEARGAVRSGSGGTFNGNVALLANATLSTDGVATTTYNGNISGGFTLTVNGTGSATAASKMVFTGNNTHAATTVNDILNINSDAALGAPNGLLTLNTTPTLQAGANNINLAIRPITITAGAIATIDTQANNMAIGGVIAATTGAIIKAGSGALTLSGINLYSGATTVSAGTLTVTGSIASSTSTVSSGGTLNGTGVTGPITINAGGVVSGVLTTGAVQVNANGSLLGSVTGAVQVSSGGIVSPAGAGTAGAISTGALTLAQGGNINLDLVAPGSSDSIAVTGNADLNGFVNVISSSPATGNYTIMTYTGTLVNGGANLAVGTLPFGFTGSLDFSTAGVVKLTINAATTRTWTALGADTLWSDVANWDGGVSIPSPGDAVIINSAGTNVTVNVAVDISGMSINRNTAVIIDSATGGTLGIRNGGISITGTTTVTISAPVVLEASQSWLLSSGSVTASNSISGNFTLTKGGAGTLFFTAANTYGATVISAGTLQIDNGGAAGTLGTGGVLDDGTLAFGRSDNPTISNVVSGTGAVQQLGSGVLILNSVNTYTGATTVSTGTLR